MARGHIMCKEDSRAINCRRRYHSRYLSLLFFCVHNRAIELQARAAHHHVTIIVNFMRIPSHMSITTFLPRRFVSHPPKKAHIVVCSLSRPWWIRRFYTSVTILSTQSFHPLSTKNNGIKKYVNNDEN